MMDIYYYLKHCIVFEFDNVLTPDLKQINGR